MCTVQRSLQRCKTRWYTRNEASSLCRSRHLMNFSVCGAEDNRIGFVRGGERSRSDWRETPLWRRNDAFLLCWFSFVIYLYLEHRRVPCLCILSSWRRTLRTEHGCVVLCVKTRQSHGVHVTNTSGWASRGRWCELRCCDYLRLPHDQRVAMSWPDTHTF